MVASTNALIGYRTNPHLDQRARGVEAAELIWKTLQGGEARSARSVSTLCDEY